MSYLPLIVFLVLWGVTMIICGISIRRHRRRAENAEAFIRTLSGYDVPEREDQ